LAYWMHLFGATLHVVQSSSSGIFLTVFVALSFHSVYNIYSGIMIAFFCLLE
jgi:hypothetical protein